MSKSPASTLSIENLSINAQEKQLVRGISFTINKGEVVALVGESGSGKSLTALAIMRLLEGSGLSIASGAIHLDQHRLYPAEEEAIRPLRGDKMAMIFQEPMRSLNPLHKIKRQITESLFLHQNIGKKEAYERCFTLLERVGIDRVSERMEGFPHQLSGGQRQRVMIAMALANAPDLLIADEPTTALDVTIQQQILGLLADLKQEMGMAMLFITHDLKLVRQIADHVLVMREGKIVESADKASFFASPQHPYSQALLNCTPTPRIIKAKNNDKPPLLNAQDLSVWFPLKKGIFRQVHDHIKAVDGISLRLDQGRNIGIVGESGSGKTTLVLAILKLIKARGSIEFAGQKLDRLSGTDIRTVRKHMQMVFQDPFGSLSPRMMVGDIITEGLIIHQPLLSKQERWEMTAKSLEEVGLDADMAYRYPHEFSGGQRQRIAIARALILKPKMVILDEPTSAMDVQTQLQLLNLLTSLQEKHQLSYLLVSHDLGVIRALADEIIVMKQGKIIEHNHATTLLKSPNHPYTKTLIQAAMLENPNG